MTIARREDAVAAGRVQSLFRAVNERVTEPHERLEPAGDTYQVACECADDDCRELLEIGRRGYRALRSHGTRFAVLPGHVVPGIERVVAVANGYVVVEKYGVAADVAAELAVSRRPAGADPSA